MSERGGESAVTPGGGSSELPGISVGLLGPFQVSVNHVPVQLTAGRLQILLVVLALSSGRAVTIDRLAASVWTDGHQPDNVRRSVQTYVARLRRLLGVGSIGSTSAGYVLRAEPEQVDVLRFVRLLRNSSEASDAAEQRKCLAEALALWRGRPFEGVPATDLVESETSWLLEGYLTALERRLDLDLAAGRHRGLLVELSELVTRHPLRESLWTRLIIALDRSGRRADALAQYDRMRAKIATELGVDPDPTLQRIHADLLAGRAPSLEHVDKLG